MNKAQLKAKRVQVRMLRRRDSLLPGVTYNLPANTATILVASGVAVIVVAAAHDPDHPFGPSETKIVGPAELKDKTRQRRKKREAETSE